MRNTIKGAIAVLTIQATTALAAALAAWIPFVGANSMYLILGSLAIQFALIISAIIFMTQLNSCLSSGGGNGSGNAPVSVSL